jgi:hypothetical protein
MMPAFLLATTATAMGLVAHVTGSWGAAGWAVVLAPLSAAACVYDAHTRRVRDTGGDLA